MRFASQRASWHLSIEAKHVDIAYNLEHQKKTIYPHFTRPACTTLGLLHEQQFYKQYMRLKTLLISEICYWNHFTRKMSQKSIIQRRSMAFTSEDLVFNLFLMAQRCKCEAERLTLAKILVAHKKP